MNLFKRFVRSSWFKLSKLIAAMLFQVTKGEEESIMTGASVLDFAKWHRWTPDPNALITGTFKSFIALTTHTKNEIAGDLSISLQIASIFLLNRAHECCTA